MATAKFEVKEVKMVQVGQNLNVTIAGEKFTVKGDKETLTPIKDKVKAYIAKPTKALFDAMTKALKPETTKVAEEAEALKSRIKATKNKVKEAEKETSKPKKVKVADVVSQIDEKEFSDKELADMEAAIQRVKAKKQTQAAPAPQARRRGGEY